MLTQANVLLWPRLFDGFLHLGFQDVRLDDYDYDRGNGYGASECAEYDSGDGWGDGYWTESAGDGWGSGYGHRYTGDGSGSITR